MVRIVGYTPDYREKVLALSLRAWAPVFPLVRDSVPGFVYGAFYPLGWEERQYRDMAAVLDDEPENVAMALESNQLVGWVCTRLHPEDSMSEVYVLAVDPAHQRKGIGRALIDYSFDVGREAGMSMVLVETGDDPGHEPARRVYEALGFERWPVARYFKNLSD
jgi:GNAT superfamily N-acetyltransferase